VFLPGRFVHLETTFRGPGPAGCFVVDEVPAELLVKIEDPIDADTGMPLLDGPRKTKLRDGASCASLLSDAAFYRAMDKFENGEFETFEEACTEEGKKLMERRNGRRYRDTEVSNEDASEESAEEPGEEDNDYMDEDHDEQDEAKAGKRSRQTVKPESKPNIVSPLSTKRKRSTVVGTDDDSAVGTRSAKKKRGTEPKTLSRQSAKGPVPILETPPKRETPSRQAKQRLTAADVAVSADNTSSRRKQKPTEALDDSPDESVIAPNSKRKRASVASQSSRRQTVKGK